MQEANDDSQQPYEEIENVDTIDEVPSSPKRKFRIAPNITFGDREVLQNTGGKEQAPRKFMVMGLCTSEDFPDQPDYGWFGEFHRRLNQILSAMTAEMISDAPVSLVQRKASYRVFEQVIIDAFEDFGVDLSLRLGIFAGHAGEGYYAVASSDRNMVLKLLLGQSESFLSDDDLDSESTKKALLKSRLVARANENLDSVAIWLDNLLCDPRLDNTTLADVRINSAALEKRRESGADPVIIVRELLLQTVMLTRLYMNSRS